MAPERRDYSSDEEEEDEEGWDEWTEPAQQAQSLFDDELFKTPEAALEHDKAVHGVDIALIAMTLDMFERIRLINWIRQTRPEPSSLLRLDRNAAWLQDDALLKPIIEDDPLLQLDYDLLALDTAPSTSAPPRLPAASHEEVANLRAQLADSQQALEQLTKLYHTRMGDFGDLSEGAAVASGSQGVKGKERDDDSHYFESYAYNDIHEIMLKDKIRTEAYRDFILNNPSIFKGAVVLDVGCGTGILSMFAVQAGARKVYAVDASAVVFKAERNIKDNSLSEIITVIKGKVESIDLPEKVDIIISEWMGYFLLYECMLDSVLHARDRFLKPGGLMIPSQTSILLSLFDGSDLVKDRISFWDGVYGYKMASMKEEIYDEALIDVVKAEDIVSSEIALSDIVTSSVTVPDLSFEMSFSLTATRTSHIHAFLGHFDTYFTSDGRQVSSIAPEINKGEVSFTTGAKGTPTHWKQTLFLLRQPIEAENGTKVEGTFKCSKNPDNSRELVVEMTWRVTPPSGVASDLFAQVWKVR